MSHPVYPAEFPAAPTLGQVFDAGASGVWQFTSIGWVKKEINLQALNNGYPIWPGDIVNVTHGGGGVAV